MFLEHRFYSALALHFFRKMFRARTGLALQHAHLHVPEIKCAVHYVCNTMNLGNHTNRHLANRQTAPTTMKINKQN